MSTFQSRRKLKNENCVRPLKGGNRGVCQEKQFRPSAAVPGLICSGLQITNFLSPMKPLSIVNESLYQIFKGY